MRGSFAELDHHAVLVLVLVTTAYCILLRGIVARAFCRQRMTPTPGVDTSAYIFEMDRGTVIATLYRSVSVTWTAIGLIESPKNVVSTMFP